MQKYYWAIDIGASSGRHICGWIENGVLKTEEIYRFSNFPERIDGHLKWNTSRLFQEILNGLKKAGEIGKIPVSVGVDTWGVDYVLLDKNDKVIDETYCYRDSRTDEIIEKVHNKLSFASCTKGWVLRLIRLIRCISFFAISNRGEWKRRRVF